MNYKPLQVLMNYKQDLMRYDSNHIPRTQVINQPHEHIKLNHSNHNLNIQWKVGDEHDGKNKHAVYENTNERIGMEDPHIYVIHLKHRTDRKREFMSAWTRAAYPTEKLHWHAAVLGSALSDEKLANFSTLARTRKGRAGRVGCYCSHVAAIQRAIQKNHFPLLVLEDDAIPTSNISLKSLFESAPPSSKLLYFGALPVKNRKRMTEYCKNKNKNKNKQNGWSAVGAEQEQLYASHAYGFPNRESAQEVLAFLETHKMTYDSALIRWTKSHKNEVSVYCPFQFIQSEGFSNIEGAKRPTR